MKTGSLYKNKAGDILLYQECVMEDYHKRSKTYIFKVICSKAIKGDTVELSSNYLNYLEILPMSHPAWILYGKGLK